MPRTKPKRTLPIEVLSDHEVDLLLRTCNRRSPSGLRDRALIALLYGTGVRIGEALALRAMDVDLAQGLIQVIKGKTGPRRVGINQGNAAIVEAWLTYRAGVLGLKPSGLLFCAISSGPVRGNKVGQPLNAACIRQMLARRRRRAGIEKRVHCHGFRHTHASQLAAARQPMPLIARALGHRSIATTSRYIDHIAPQDVIAAQRALNSPPATPA